MTKKRLNSRVAPSYNLPGNRSRWYKYLYPTFTPGTPLTIDDWAGLQGPKGKKDAKSLRKIAKAVRDLMSHRGNLVLCSNLPRALEAQILSEIKRMSKTKKETTLRKLQ